MNNLVNYIFKNMDKTDKRFICIYKKLVHQNKFNKTVILCGVATIINLLAIHAENKKMQQEIASLQKEINDLMGTEGE